MKHIKKLEPGGTFDDTKLIEGWLIKENNESKGSKKEYTWQKRTSSEIKKERERLIIIYIVASTFNKESRHLNLFSHMKSL